MKLREANIICRNEIQKLVQARLKSILNKYEVGEKFKEADAREMDALFLIRDGMLDNILDEEKLEEYDNCYGIEDLFV